MSTRLGLALAKLLEQRLRPGERSFVIMEGVSSSIARGIADGWDDARMPRLAIASSSPQQFGRYALDDSMSGTNLRNNGLRGVVLVMCDGEQLPDRQSLNLFDSVSPSDLLDDQTGVLLLAQQSPAVADLDGPCRAVRTAIVEAGPAARPSALAVAAYFDRLAAGEKPLAALPTLGAFTDSPPPGTPVDSARILDNLELAARTTGDDTLGPASFPDLRRRAERIMRQRPGLTEDDCKAAVDRVMQQLADGDEALLSSLTFDDARDVLQQRTEKLPDVVRREIEDFRAGLLEGSQAYRLTWHLYLKRAGELGRGPLRRAAAKELCDLDDAQERGVFTRRTRAKLESQQRDTAVNGSSPSCPEGAIVRAARQLGGTLIDRVQVISPQQQTASSRSTNRTGAGRILTLACARLRLGGLVRTWHNAGGDVDGLLLRSAIDDDLGGRDGVLAAFRDAGLANGGTLPALQLRLHAADGTTSDNTTVQVEWKPDLDDAALLHAALLFGETPALTLLARAEPTLLAFCSGESPAPLPFQSAAAQQLAQHLHRAARSALEHGLTPQVLAGWAQAWTDAVADREAHGDANSAEELALAGAVRSGKAAALTPLAPLKAEWLAQHLEALWNLLRAAEEPRSDADPGNAAAAAAGIARTTASHYPTYLRLRNQDRPLLPASEGRIWSLYGGASSRDESGFAGEAFCSVVRQLLTLQPEAAGHLRCLAWGPGAADLLSRQAVPLLGTQVGGAVISKIELFCIGDSKSERPSNDTLALLDEQLRGQRDAVQLRYLPDLESAKRALKPGPASPAVHLALVTGLTEGGQRLEIDNNEVPPPALDPEVLFAPRVWQRPGKDRRTLLMPPAATATGLAWLRLQNAVDDVDDGWPDGDELVVPEVRTGTLDIRDDLEQVHDLALWVATLDRYATRDSLEKALGDRVAILHQERRLGGDSPLSLVLSQKSGGPADRAIGRSLRAAGIVSDAEVAFSIGTDLRRVASQGYGILALQAATSGAGINELVGHVVAFSMLATTATPWPLPPGCRVLLVSLDEYRHWFPGKRADLLAIALDPDEGGVHVACIEVKARRSDERNAAEGAMDQLNQTLAATRWAAQPEPGNIHSRLWLNRIAEAAYAVARESRFRLTKPELDALERFRLGHGSLEWAGVGLVFGPHIEQWENIQHQPLGRDIVPVALYAIPLTQQLLRQATDTDLTKLKTVETHRPPLQSSRVRRRPERNDNSGTAPRNAQPPIVRHGTSTAPPSAAYDRQRSPAAADTSRGQGGMASVTDRGEPTSAAPATAPETGSAPSHSAASMTGPDAGRVRPFSAPLLGWDSTGQEVRWRPAGESQNLNNGHLQIWGSSGMGKTQFVMCLLAQLSRYSGSRFGIADFKNDYSGETGFPAFAGAEFINLWENGVPYNPLALEDDSPRTIDTAVIEVRDIVEEAARAFVRIGHKQREKIQTALYKAYGVRGSEGRWPTFSTLNDELDSELASVMGDLTRYDLFRAGPPLGHVIDRNVVFGLSKIPGNGQTTVLAAAFILSALLLRVQSLPPVPNTIRYLAVVDEAHRVKDFRAVQTMIREGRSKGLAVVLATQQPLDLPEVVSANAQTKICFGLPDATVATMAARRLDPDNPRLAEQIRTLGKSEAFLSLGGEAPVLMRMTQAFRDYEVLGLPELVPVL